MIWPTCGIGEEKHTGRVRLINTAVCMTCRQVSAVHGICVVSQMVKCHRAHATYTNACHLAKILLSGLEALA